jgi:hypothetical protein
MIRGIIHGFKVRVSTALGRLDPQVLRQTDCITWWRIGMDTWWAQSAYSPGPPGYMKAALMMQLDQAMVSLGGIMHAGLMLPCSHSTPLTKPLNTTNSLKAQGLTKEYHKIHLLLQHGTRLFSRPSQEREIAGSGPPH